MKNVRRFRAMGSLCRQQAAYNPAQSWRLLAEAEYWEHLAQAEMSSHFNECNADNSSDPAKPRATPPTNDAHANDAQWETVSAA
jgi:hypothetical protein